MVDTLQAGEEKEQDTIRMTAEMEIFNDEQSSSSLFSKDTIALWVTYLNIVLYGLCFQLQRPIEPFLVKSLSSKASEPAVIAETYGRLQSFFNAAQTLGSPLVGMLLDRIGIRNASAIVFSATALSYAILAGATDLRLLFISKIPTVFMAAFLVAQATAAVTATEETARAKALGRMTSAYTIVSRLEYNATTDIERIRFAGYSHH